MGQIVKPWWDNQKRQNIPNLPFHFRDLQSDCRISDLDQAAWGIGPQLLLAIFPIHGNFFSILLGAVKILVKSWLVYWGSTQAPR
jgi:hypothetical protein